MRTLAIGDIHGCSTALDLLLKMVKPQPDDMVVTLGDYVDRGPDTKGVIDRVLALKDECRLYPLKGNHEIMMLEARKSADWERTWMTYGGKEALQSYPVSQDGRGAVLIPAAHWQFLQNECLNFVETETHIFVHAGLDPALPPDQQTEERLFWEHLKGTEPPHSSGKTVICGHTAMKKGYPLNLGHTICIDTWACGNGFLSCLDVNRGVVYQASQSGMRREMKLQAVAPVPGQR